MKKKHIAIIAVLVLILSMLLYVCATLERKTVPQKEQNNEAGIGTEEESEKGEPNNIPATENNREETSGNTETNSVEDDTTEATITEVPKTDISATNPSVTEPPTTEPPTTEPPATESSESGSGNVLPEDEF